jgi:teichuronic acid biosynthesis glycosyltransferase TuaH
MLLNGRQIIIFGLPRVHAEIESTNYTTARILSKNNEVYYVENPYTFKDYFNFKGTAEYKFRKKHLSLFGTSIIKGENPGLFIVIPPVLLSVNFLPEGFFFRTLLNINEFLIGFKLKRLIRKRGIKDFIFINSFNFHYPRLANHLNATLTVYHCLDPLVLPFNRKHGDVSESILVRESDVVICSSRALYDEKKMVNPNTYFVPNAADLSHSMKVLDPFLEVSDIVGMLKRPLIGYFGAIERRIDYEMLRKVAEGNPDKTFVFVGPVGDDFVPGWFKHLPNVKLTGPVPYDQMPAVLKGFDVALIPFKKDDVSRTIFPLKLFEYLGSGKPVVCTDFNPDLAEFTNNTVNFCKNAAAFSSAIDDALHNDTPEKKDLRLAVASDNTWEKRVTEIGNIIAQNLLNKPKSD